MPISFSLRYRSPIADRWSCLPPRAVSSLPLLPPLLPVPLHLLLRPLCFPSIPFAVRFSSWVVVRRSASIAIESPCFAGEGFHPLRACELPRRVGERTSQGHPNPRARKRLSSRCSLHAAVVTVRRVSCAVPHLFRARIFGAQVSLPR